MTAASTQRVADIPENLAFAFERACMAHAGDVAFSCFGHETSFAQLEAATRRCAAFFSSRLGLRKGDRIAIQLPSITQYPVAAWGAIRAGLTIVNTNPMYTERELHHQLSDSGARAIVLLGGAVESMAAIAARTDVEHILVVGPREAGNAQIPTHGAVLNTFALDEIIFGSSVDLLPDIEISMEDIAVLQYTGGTTGVAKGCMLSHGNVYASYTQLSEAIPPHPTKRSIMIAPMPLYHVYGFQTNVVSFLLGGGMSVLVPDPRNLGSVIEAMRAYPFTHLAGVNTLLNGLMRHPDFDTVDFSHADYTFAGGTALARSVAREWYKRTGVHVYEGYSMSETSSALCLNTQEHRELGTVGRPHSATEVKLATPVSVDATAEPRGELLVRGPQVMQGYWQRPDATAETIDGEGWLHTGDIAVIQDNGFVRIVDRLKDLVLVSGFNVYPNEIEAVIASHPEVIDCAAIGVPDEQTGEAVKVFLSSTNDALSAADIREFCRTQLTAYKVPKHVEFLSELPKSPAGKILRRELREMSRNTRN
ncbi:MAG: long-chain fatty acid--CoA ligase [Pseudomonadota bacterium]